MAKNWLFSSRVCYPFAMTNHAEKNTMAEATFGRPAMMMRGVMCMRMCV
jgi:hypothetical protein